MKIENLDNVYRKLLVVKDNKMFEKTRICSDFCNIFAQMAISDIEDWFASDNNLVHNDIAINYDLKFNTDLSKKIADKLSRK